MTSPAHTVQRDDLTAHERAVVDENWIRANEGLDALLDLNGRHRDEGCTDWFCGTPALAERLDELEPHAMHMVLRAAMERLRGAEGRRT